MRENYSGELGRLKLSSQSLIGSGQGAQIIEKCPSFVQLIWAVFARKRVW